MSVISLKTRQKYGSLLAGNQYYIPPSFESIASAVGNDSSLTITFSSIPSTYQHLQIRISAVKTTTTSEELRLRFNGDTATNYSWHNFSGYNTTVSARAGTSQTYIQVSSNVGSNADMSTTAPSIAIVDIHDYASTTKNKAVKSFGGVDQNITTNSDINLNSGLWRSTSAINSITIFMPNNGANFKTTTTISLYGIRGA